MYISTFKQQNVLVFTYVYLDKFKKWNLQLKLVEKLEQSNETSSEWLLYYFAHTQ